MSDLGRRLRSRHGDPARAPGARSSDDVPRVGPGARAPARRRRSRSSPPTGPAAATSPSSSRRWPTTRTARSSSASPAVRPSGSRSPRTGSIAGAVLHEPAVGSLVPGLLDHVVAGFTSGGVPGFGAALYGPSWTPAMAPADPDAVARDLAMFRRFEPAALHPGQGRVVVTVGEHSPPARHRAAWALHERFGVEVRVLPGTGHFVQHDHPEALVAVVRICGAGRVRSAAARPADSSPAARRRSGSDPPGADEQRDPDDHQGDAHERRTATGSTARRTRTRRSLPRCRPAPGPAGSATRARAGGPPGP